MKTYRNPTKKEHNIQDKLELDSRLAEFDEINKPKHYADRDIEVIDYIKDTLNNPNLNAYEGYCIGNIIKYLSRAGLKGSKETDFKKAQYYINKLL